MLLELHEFIRDSKTKQVCWIEKIGRETIEIGYATYDNGEYGKNFTVVTRKDFYKKYEDLQRG